MASLGYDLRLCAWDVETGKQSVSLELPSLGFVLAGDPSHPHEVLVGCQDAKILQYDLRSGDCVQRYERHLQSVNTITFFDEGRRFVSSSDDKTLRYWEYGTPVEIRIHQEPHMHSMPQAAPHLASGWAAFQSMDNQILLYGISQDSGYKLNRKKRYLGHLVAGYACGLDWSPDGAYIVSGDSEGKLFVWDAKTSRVVRKLSGAHRGAVLSVLWHPAEPSRVVSGAKDGKIIFWD